MPNMFTSKIPQRNGEKQRGAPRRLWPAFRRKWESYGKAKEQLLLLSRSRTEGRIHAIVNLRLVGSFKGILTAESGDLLKGAKQGTSQGQTKRA